MNFRKSFWIKVGVGIFVVLVIILALQSFKKKESSQYPFFSATPTPILFQTQSYSDTNQHYTIQYPQDWQKDTTDNPSAATQIFTFTENNTTYRFIISPPVGNTIPDMTTLHADSKQSIVVYYGRKPFKRTIYLSSGNPVYLYATPEQPNFSFYNFLMQLPPTNTDTYMQLFDQILTNMQIHKSFDPSEILSR